MEKTKIIDSWGLKATIQKSFYKKAYVLEDEKGSLFLQSYDTIVCGIADGNFKRFWDGYSVTTMNHINDFRIQNNFETMRKKEWNSLNIESDPINYAYHRSANMGNQYYGIHVMRRW